MTIVPQGPRPGNRVSPGSFCRARFYHEMRACIFDFPVAFFMLLIHHNHLVSPGLPGRTRTLQIKLAMASGGAFR
jgi:hypothetical protein